MLINDVEINRDKIFEQDKYSKPVIQPPRKRTDLLDTVNHHKNVLIYLVLLKLFYNFMKQFNHI